MAYGPIASYLVNKFGSCRKVCILGMIFAFISSIKSFYHITVLYEIRVLITVYVILGGLVSTLGFTSAAFSTSLIILILTYGIVGGIGSALIYMPGKLFR